MADLPIRPLLATTAAAAVLTFGLSGHGLPPQSHDAMSGAAVGVCVLLATALARLRTPPFEAAAPALATEATRALEATTAAAPADRRSRASPRTLKRFRN